MAELVNAADLSSASINGLGVRVTPPAPKFCNKCGKAINRKSKLWCKQCDPHVIIEESKLNINFVKSTDNLHLVAEYELMKICALCGFDFAVPLSKSPYDLLVDFGEGMKKIQVKSSYYKTKSGNYEFSLDKTRNNATISRKIVYTESEVNYFFLYDCDKNKWLIPFNLIGKMRSIVPMIKYPGYQIHI